ncbi:MAG: hypothetical protein NVSMB21_12410 [Vulcanimicrobiaceae bacterium]
MNITLRSQADVLAAIERATSIELSAYVLAPHGAMVGALVAAAERGAHVAVTLDGAPYLGPGSSPADAIANAAADLLRARGVEVRASAATDPPVHLKAAIADGRAFLDDRNWPATGRDTVVETDDPGALDAIRRAIGGRARSTPDLALEKAAALELEAATILAAGDRVDVASESFGASVVADALCERARAGASVRLEVDGHALACDRSGREHRALARLAAAGVAVRAVGAAEKYAVAGSRLWVGSANATSADGAMLDWGVRSDDARLAASLAASFERAWASGTPVAAAQSPKRSRAVALVRAITSAIGMARRSAT